MNQLKIVRIAVGQRQTERDNHLADIFLIHESTFKIETTESFEMPKGFTITNTLNSNKPEPYCELFRVFWAFRSFGITWACLMTTKLF